MYLILLILLAAPLLAQDVAPGPVPTPEVSPSPSTDATPPAEPSPTAAAAASPEAAPEASSAASPAADEDMIPLPPESGAAESPIVSESEVAPVLRPGPGESLPDSAFADPNAVIPDEPGAAAAGPSGPSAGELERKLKIRYREVRTEMEKDPAVRSLWDQAQSATSFEDERAALREFYRLLFKKMKKVDKDLTARCDAMERAYINRLAQTRQEPTIPLNPPPTPEPLGN